MIRQEIGLLFRWLNDLKVDKYVHPVTINEIQAYKNKDVVNSFTIKLDSYNLIKYPLPFSETIHALSKSFDQNQNDINDTMLLNEVHEGTVDLLITEDKKLYLKASEIGLKEKVFTIQSYLEKVSHENPTQKGYDILAVKKVDFGEVNLADSFFDTFRSDYKELPFNKWFRKKYNDSCYVCYSNENDLSAFLYIKVENENESYNDINPTFSKKKRLKIGTLKVISNGYKIGERFLKIVFDNAIQYKVDEIYVTLFNKRPEQADLIDMLEEWGFVKFGIKSTINGEELVLTRTFGKSLSVNIKDPKKTFPFFSRETRKYIVKIEPQYHTELFPDSINTREDKSNYLDNQPHRNRIGKVYISHSKDRFLKPGDIIIIYRMGESTPKRYSSTVTSICIVEEVFNSFKSFDDFYSVCVRRTLIERAELETKWWNRFPTYKPFVIKFLYAHSFPTPKPTLNDLIKLGVIKDIKNMPKGFIEINNDQFNRLVNFAYKITRT